MVKNNLYLAHHGIKGQKWGVRRFQNPDGTLTQAGKDRYNLNGLNLNDKAVGSKREKRKQLANEAKQLKKSIDATTYDELDKASLEAWNRYVTKEKKKGREPNPDEWDEDFYEKQKDIVYSAETAARKYVNEYLSNKYGEETFKDLQKHLDRKTKTATALFVGGMASLPIAAISYAFIANKNKW